MDTELFVKAFNQAKDLRGRVLLRETIFHSDHGSQYTSDLFKGCSPVIFYPTIHGSDWRFL